MTLNIEIIDLLTNNLHSLSSSAESIIKELEPYKDTADFKDIIKYVNEFIDFGKESERELKEFNVNSSSFPEFLRTKRHILRDQMNVIKGHIEIAAEESQQSSKFEEVKNHIGKILEAIAKINVRTPTEKYTFEHTEDSEEFKSFKEKFAILVVDDIKDNCRLLQRYLKHFGYPNTQMANNGEQALELLDKSTFNLLLLDINMPGITGIEVLKQLKDNIFQRQLSVIMITVSDEVKNALECIRLGAEDYLLKPFDVDRLRVHISSIVEKKWYSEKHKKKIPIEQIEEEKRQYTANLNNLWKELNQTLPNPLPERVDVSHVPEPYSLWLGHTGLILPRMEKFFGQRFKSKVIDKKSHNFYTRKTIFNCENKNVLVSYMHINLSSFSPEVGEMIVEGKTSLSRIFAKAGIEISMLLHSQIKIYNWNDIEDDISFPIYGRLVTFFIQGKPAVELLEITISRGEPQEK